MKTVAALLMFLVLFLPTAPAQEDTQLNLPEGAVARLGKGKVSEVLYSPDGTWLAVVSSIGIWFYDTSTYRAVALLRGSSDRVNSVVFSPASITLVGVRWGKTVRLLDVKTGEQKRVFAGLESSATSLSFSEQNRGFTGHENWATSVSFSPDGTTPCQWELGRDGGVVEYQNG